VARFGKRHGVALLLAIAAFQLFLIVLRYPRAFAAFGTVPVWMRMLEPPVLFTTLADWALYFPLGLVFGMHDAALKPHLRKLQWVAVGATVGLFILTGLHGLRIVSAPLARLAVPLPLMCLLPIIHRQWLPAVNRLEMLGRRSYAIYLGHFVVINLLVLIATSSTFDFRGLPAVVFPLFFVVALGTPVVAMNVMTTVPPARRVYRYLFGIVPPAAEMPRPLGAHGSR
jgi:membrane-bound acyltransferase YfiQ involved in biofilm formation